MQNSQPSKQFRWVGQPSEEELLGIRVSTTRHAQLEAVTAPRVSPPPERPVLLAPTPARRLRGRDFLTVLAVGALVWLVLGGAGTGFRFPGSEPAAVPDTLDPAPARVVIDRAELTSLPRTVPSSDRGAGDRQVEQGGRAGDRGSSSGGKDEQEPPPGGGGDEPAQPPLAQVTVPGVGTVTVDEPDVLPTETLPSPADLPDTGEILPETPPLPLP